MRVLLFRSLCDTGGVSTSMLLLGREMARRGIACEYWFCQTSNRFAEFAETGMATLGSVSGLAERLDRGDFDVVHMTASDPAAELVARMARGKARVVVTARGALSDNWNHTNCLAYTAISKGMAEVNQPYTDLEIEVVRNAIEVDRFSPPVASNGESPIVAFVGRTTAPEKDFPRFTRIARRLAERGARIWIADPHESTMDVFLEHAAERIEPERWGRVAFADIPEFYRAVAASGGLVLMTSRTEGFGNVAPEAAACGARVAAPDVMGLREAIIDGVTGRLFAADASDDDVAAQLQHWLESPHDMQQCANATRSAFSSVVLGDAYMAIYARTQARLAAATPVHSASPELEKLREHLRWQHGWRAAESRAGAQDLANAGFADLSLGALSIAFRNAPRQFLTKSGSRQLLATLRRITSRTTMRRMASRMGRG